MSKPYRSAKWVRATRQKASEAWRQRKADNFCCVYCGDPLPENDLRTGCPTCRRKAVVRAVYRRWFLSNFS